MSDSKTPVIGHVTPLQSGEPTRIADDRAWETLAQARARMDVKTYPPATLQRLQAELEEAEVLQPGSTWTGPDGTVYDVVRAEDVGDRPRWWFLAGFRGDQIGLEHPGELHTDAAPGGTSGLLALVLSHACAVAGCPARTEAEVEACMRPDCDADGGLTVGDVAAFSLETARALLARADTESADPDDQAELWAGLSAACDEVERLRGRVSGLEVDLAAAERRSDAHAEEVERLEREAARRVASYDRLREAIEMHLPECSGDLMARIANAGAALAGARASRDAYHQEARTRIDVVQRLERTEATLKRWQARARKAEARVAVLTEERDGLTLRLGAKVRRDVVTAGGKLKTVLEIGKRASGGANHGLKLIEPATGRRAPARTRKGGRR